ncbi:MAG: type IV pilin protein [Lysobacterales bacterium]
MTNTNAQTVVRPRICSGHPRRLSAGFTLVEILIVLAIVAILSAVAYASYNEAVWKSHRRAGAACAVEAAQFMERFYTTNLRYDQTLAGAGVALPVLPCAADSDYVLSLAAGTTPTTYTINATPNPTQTTRDNRGGVPRCGVLSINQANVKTESGSETPAVCWD